MRSHHGFTLIELIITVSIIAILTGIATLSYTSIQKRARDTQRKNDIGQIKIGLSTYFTSQVPAQYIASSSGSSPSKITVNGSTDALSSALKGSYMKTVPVDPLNTLSNVYKYQSVLTSGVTTDYTLFATLENKNDKAGWAGGSSWVADGYQVQNE